MIKDNKIFLFHILESIENIEEYITDIDREKFLSQKKVQDAVIRRLEIIGEAAKNLPKDFTKKYKEIPWLDIIESFE